MKYTIVSASEPILLAGGGEFPKSDLIVAQKWARRAVAADSGAEPLLRFGVQPEAVIGDFDSLDDRVLAALPENVLHLIPEQDGTDFDKCLRNIDAPLIIGLGFLGARVDHQLAVFSRMAARPDKRIILLGSDDIIFLAPPVLELSLKKGTRLSLFPMAPVTGRSTGLLYPVDGLKFAPDGRVGTSNEVTVGKVRIEMDKSGMLVILPRDCLPEALKAVQAAGSGTWNARG